MFPSTEVSAMSSPQLVVFSPKQRPDRSPNSVGFIDQISSDDEKSQPCSRKMSDTISSSSVVPCYQSTQDKSEVAHHDLAHLVDLYLDLVISRSFNRYRSSCWLFWRLFYVIFLYPMNVLFNGWISNTSYYEKNCLRIVFVKKYKIGTTQQMQSTQNPVAIFRVIDGKESPLWSSFSEDTP